MTSEDPYRYFRVEAREIVDSLAREILDLEKGVPTAETISALLRQAHTLKGAARVVKLIELADLAHAIEEVLLPYRDAPRAVPREQIEQLLRSVDAITAGLAALGSESGAAVAAPAAPVPASQATRAPAPVEMLEPFERVRVEITDLDMLLARTAETAAQIERIYAAAEEVVKVEKLFSAFANEWNSNGAALTKNSRRDHGALQRRDTVEELRQSILRVEHSLTLPVEAARREIGLVRESGEQLRLLPASVLFAPMERAVRDAAATLAKRVEWESAGGNVRLEGRVLSAVGQALLHLARNAVAHGIESPAARVAVGKPPAGKIRLSVERRGRRIAFVCSDDGGGIDFDGVRRVAVRLGLVPAASAAALSDADLTDLLLTRGLTTTDSAGAIAGRGIGLTVVAQASAELKGHVKVRSGKGRGTTVEIEVPLSLSSQAAMLVEAGGAQVWFPLEAVRCALRLKPDDMVNSAGRESVLFEGSAIPLVRLAPLMGAAVSRNGTRAMRSAVVLQSGSEILAAGVDRVIRTAEVIVHPLGAHLRFASLLAGASFDAEGNLQLVIDPAALREARRPTGAVEAEARAPQPHILVIDDSLTSRMLEQSILESEGYEVDVASSAEEGLSKAHESKYKLFVCDIEMPGMNGFEFVEHARESNDLREIPSIMVTMRDDEESRQHALQVGARAYICKGDFDQRALLSKVRELVR